MIWGTESNLKGAQIRDKDELFLSAGPGRHPACLFIFGASQQSNTQTEQKQAVMMLRSYCWGGGSPFGGFQWTKSSLGGDGTALSPGPRACPAFLAVILPAAPLIRCELVC